MAVTTTVWVGVALVVGEPVLTGAGVWVFVGRAPEGVIAPEGSGQY